VILRRTDVSTAAVAIAVAAFVGAGCLDDAPSSSATSDTSASTEVSVDAGGQADATANEDVVLVPDGAEPDAGEPDAAIDASSGDAARDGSVADIEDSDVADADAGPDALGEDVAPETAGEDTTVDVVEEVLPTDYCAEAPCLNDGTCTSVDDGFVCACAAGFEGETCAINVDDCAPAPCLNGGTCTDAVNGFICACAPGYEGDTCATDIDDCAAAPCFNDGFCVDGVNSFSCVCVPGFSGDTCATNIDDCVGAPCLNGGTCVDGVDAYTCSCAPGYEGETCDTEIDECAADPCLNGGICTDLLASFSCDCAGTGFSGGTCEVNIDDCPIDACANGGSCVDGINDYSCDCPSLWGGDACEDVVLWAATTVTGTIGEPGEVTLVDLDNDGDLDATTNHNNPRRQTWWDNDGGVLSELHLSATETKARWHSVFDFNGDEYPDILACGYASLQWITNPGDDLPDTDWISFVGTYNHAMGMPVDDDALDDVIAYNQNDDTIDLYLNNADGTFAGQVVIDTVVSTGFRGPGMAAIDVDNDNDMDLVVAVNNLDLLVWYPNNDGTFGSALTIDDAASLDARMIAVDLDGDTYDDLLGIFGGSVVWYRNQQDGTFAAADVLADSADGSNTTVRAADVDGDEDMDLVVLRGGDTSIAWVEQTAAGVWSAPYLVTSSGFVVTFGGLDVADVTGDGAADIVVTDHSIPGIRILTHPGLPEVP